MSYGVRNSAAAAFLVLTVLILGNVFVSYRHLRRLYDNHAGLERTSEVRLALKETFSLLKDLELGERGYIITGNEDFLEPYRAAVTQLDEQVHRLADLYTVDAQDDEVMRQLGSLIAEKRQLVEEAIQAHNQQGFEAATAVVSAGQGKRFMDRIRELVGTLEEREQQVRDEQWRESRQSYETSQLSFALSNTAAVALVALVFILVRREAIESKRSTALLQASESRFRRLVDANVMGVLFADLEGRIVDANDAFLAMVGYSRAELERGTLDWQRMTPPEFAEQDERAIAEIKARGAARPFEKQFIRQDGERVPVLIGCALLEDPRGVCICYAIDLSEREQARREIEALNALCLQRIQELETLLEVIPIGIAIATDPQADNITLNAALARILGLTRDANSSAPLAPNADSQIVRVMQDGQPLATEQLPLRRVAASGVPSLGIELDVVRREGPAVKLLQHVAPLFDARGKPRGSVGAFIDITDRKLLEEQLRQNADDLHNQQRWLEAVLDLLPMPMLLLDRARGKVAFANKAATDMADGRFPLESAPEEDGQTAYFCTGLDGNRIPPEQMPGARVERGEHLSGYELDWHLPGGTRSLLINAGSLPPMYGHEAVSVMLFQDITQLKRIEGELRRTNEAKDALLAMLGHELRNPLAAITGAAELIRIRDPREPAFEQAQEILDRHLRHLARLVDDMLDLSRLASGKLTLQTEPCDLLVILRNAAQTVRSVIEARDHQLQLKLPTRPIWVLGDTSRLEQVFVNLLMNAAKYTDPGGTISLEAETQTQQVIVRVRDNGIGISPDLLPRVFDLFAQLNPSIDRSNGGLGIGLNVVKNLVELHGGHVQARSEGVGQGSEFVVLLPRAAAPVQKVNKPAAPVDDEPADKAYRVLIVEDNPDIARVMSALVKRCGHQPRIAHDGQAALEAAGELSPDVALLDIGLPGMNGYELARRLRREPALKNLILVALTGYGQEEDRRRSEEAGFDQHLVKPVSFDTLRDVLRHVQHQSVSHGV